MIMENPRCFWIRASDWPCHSIKRRGIDGFVHRQTSFVGIEGDLLERLNERNIESVDPDHVLIAFVGVLVPTAVRREDQVAVLHHHLVCRLLLVKKKAL